MKTTSLILGLIVALIVAMLAVFHFVHPILVLTLKDIFWIVLFDGVAAFLLALYLSDGKSKNSLIFWTIIGAIALIIPIIASVIKYNRNKSQD